MEAGQRGVSCEDGGSRWKRDYCGGYQGREPLHPSFRIPATSQFHPQDLEGNNEARALSIKGCQDYPGMSRQVLMREDGFPRKRTNLKRARRPNQLPSYLLDRPGFSASDARGG